MHQPPHTAFDDDGVLVVRFDPMNNNWREARCAICAEPIQWVLDMQSWITVNGAMKMVHAWCAWTPPAFDRAKKLARKH